MAVIRPPQDTTTPLSGGISPGAALAVGATGAAIGQIETRQAAGLQADAAREVSALSQRFFDEAKAATDTARYSSAINEAVVQLSKAKQERYNRQVDDDGNPTFSTLADDMQAIGARISEDITRNIKSPEVIQKFNQSFGGLMSNAQIEALSEARRQQDSYVRSQVNQSFQTLGDMAATGSPMDATAGVGEYSRQLHTLVQNGAITFEDATANLQKFVSNVSELRMSRMISSAPEIALAALAPDANPLALQEEGIMLTEEQRQKYSHQAQLAVNNKIRMQQATEAARLDSIKDLYKETNQLIERGGSPDPNVIQIMKNASAGTAFSASVEDLQDKAEKVSIFNSLSAVDREAVLNKMKSSGQLDDNFAMFNRINDNLKQAQSKDLFSFAISQNIIPQPAPIDMNGDLAQQLAMRRQAISLVKGHYGQDTTGVTNEEANQISASINTLPPAMKAAKLGQIVAGLGPNSTKFLSQIAKGGDRTLASIGALVAEGRKELATKILVGEQFAKEGQLKLSPTFNSSAAVDAKSVLPPVGNPEFQNDIINLAKSLYAAKSVMERDYSQNYNASRWKDSLQEVMGGETLSLNPPGKSFFASNYHIVAPVANMDEKGFTDWVGSITDSEIQRLGGWKGWRSGMAQQLKLATFEQAGFGRYVVQVPSEMSSSGYTPVMTNEGKPFILDYSQLNDLRSGNAAPSVSSQQTTPFRVDDVYKALTKPSRAASSLAATTGDMSIDNIVQQAASTHGVPENLIRAVIKQESGGDSKAVSNKGASGLMQLMPATAKELGVTDLFDPAQNINGGTKYLASLLKRYNGDVPKALAAYNAGPGIVDKVGGVPNWKETKNYVKTILKNLNDT